jgi:hypothetical protein
MNQDRSVQAQSDASGGLVGFIRIASEIAEASLRSRWGFGAFRKFDGVFRDSIDIVLQSSYFAPRPLDGPWPILAYDESLWKYRMPPRTFIGNVLTSPASYNPAPVWALFWALAKAEHEFLQRYVPYWSHEERLTGHLVSQLIERLEGFAPHWRALNAEPAKESLCRIWYADTAAARKEGVTGADLGLIVQARLGSQEEFFKVARFQSKKVGRSGKARIDLGQVRALLHHERLGYYLFYHPLDKNSWSLAPTVRPATDFQHDLEEAQQQKPSGQLGVITDLVNGRGVDLAMFVTFALADAGADHGVLASTAVEAVSVLMSGDPRPSRVLVVTLGEGTTPVEWNTVLHEWIGSQFLEE